VCTAGTGGTAATIGRFIRYRCHDTRLCVADPENSVFFDTYASGDASLRISANSLIEGIGRPRVEKSFLPGIVDGMMKIPDVASLGAIRYLERVLGRRCGGSTGTGIVATLALARRMREAGERGSIATILCDSGERYGHSYYDDAWVASHGFDIGPAVEAITGCAERGEAPPWVLPTAGQCLA
jgi:cysteine synthase A